MAAHFAKRNTKFGGGGKRGRAKIPSPQPPSFLPARAFSLAREARRQFRSKKVRISSNKRTNKIKGLRSLPQPLFIGLRLGITPGIAPESPGHPLRDGQPAVFSLFHEIIPPAPCSFPPPSPYTAVCQPYPR